MVDDLHMEKKTQKGQNAGRATEYPTNYPLISLSVERRDGASRMLLSQQCDNSVIAGATRILGNKTWCTSQKSSNKQSSV